MKDTQNAKRILKLKQVFERETDDKHELSMQDLTGKLRLHLGSVGNVDKRAIKRYIDILNDEGFEIIENTGRFWGKLYSN